MGVAELFAHGGVGQERGGCDHPADAQAGLKILLKLPQWASKSREPGTVCGQSQHGRRRRFAEVELAIRVVFHHQGVVFDGQLQHALAPRQAQRCAAGVAKGGDEVNEFGFVLGDQRFQLVGVHAVGVDRCAYDVRAVEAESTGWWRERWALRR